MTDQTDPAAELRAFVDHLPNDDGFIAGFVQSGVQYKLTATSLRAVLAELERLRDERGVAPRPFLAKAFDDIAPELVAEFEARFKAAVAEQAGRPLVVSPAWEREQAERDADVRAVAALLAARADGASMAECKHAFDELRARFAERIAALAALALAALDAREGGEATCPCGCPRPGIPDMCCCPEPCPCGADCGFCGAPPGA